MRYLLCAVMLFVQVQCLLAQDYIYSVTVGTSWAREVFPAMEIEHQKSIKDQPSGIDDLPPFGELFEEYEKNFRKFNVYNDSIFYSLTHEEWIGMFQRRAKTYSSLYAYNNRNIALIKDYFNDVNLPENAYDSLYYWTRRYFFKNVNDIFLYEQLLDILLPHYEETQDIEHLMFCYLVSGMYNYQCSRMGDKESELRSELYFHKIVNLSDRFASFTDPLNRYYLISAFVNLAVLHAQSGNVSLNESRELASSMIRLYSEPECQEVLRKDSLLNEYAKWSIDLFRYRGIFTYISRGYDIPALRDQLYKSYCDVRKEVGLSWKMKNRYYSRLEFDDLLVEAFMGNMSWDEAFERFEKLMNEDPDMNRSNVVPNMKINYLYNLYESYIAILNHTSYPFDRKKALVQKRLSDMLDMISRYDHNRYPFEKGKILVNMACNPDVLQYLSAEEKHDLIFRLIVVEQPTTYVHVSMVADLSRSLTESLIDKKPEFFVGMPGYKTVEDVRKKREELLDYVSQAAVFHDLGKISMPTIINNCFRKLTDHEFEIIQLHPEKSKKFFAIDSSLQQYQDIALGHHKWYDGDGYPAKFKNRKSPYFPVICVVSICDCMDAATENIGRNYHTPRSFEAVLSEFEAVSGEQFHPDLVSFIMSDQETYNKMKLIVSDGRYDNYYKLYLRYMKTSRRK